MTVCRPEPNVINFQREHVKFAQMFADFVDKLQGIRLRPLSVTELTNVNKKWEEQDKIKVRVK